MNKDFQLAAYDYNLPLELIAQKPASSRDQSRLLTMYMDGRPLEHRLFEDIDQLFRPGDLLVVNNTLVFPARLYGVKETGGKVEMLLLQYPQILAAPNQKDENATLQARATALIRSSKRPKPGSQLFFGEKIQAEIMTLRDDGKVDVILRFSPGSNQNMDSLLEECGELPLPPYIKRPQGTSRDDQKRYQTTYAKTVGSVAAPTAGLHFSASILKKLQEKGVEKLELTLHVGYGTFAPVRSQDIRQHTIHHEHVSIDSETADRINRGKANGARVWAVGTTTARSLEFASDETGKILAKNDLCGLYIYPGYRFRIVDNLITNFHLPQSSLLFLVSAFAGREKILAAYDEAIKNNYRFFSYGDAMALITRP